MLLSTSRNRILAHSHYCSIDDCLQTDGHRPTGYSMSRTLFTNYYILELKPIVVAIQWALVRTYWIDEPLD